MSRNGETVSAFERELAAYCGAKFAIAAANGTVTLQAALVALGIKPGDRVAVPPLTMAATTIAVLNVGAVPHFVDVDPDTWLMDPIAAANVGYQIPVSLYGLHYPTACNDSFGRPITIDDAAQTLRPFDSRFAFVSLSQQASKILALGEGGALLTNDENLASRARSYLSLGYKMDATRARIDSHALRSPTFDRHHTWPAINGRMADHVAAKGLEQLVPAYGFSERRVDQLLDERQQAATLYRNAIAGCDWLTPQHIPEGWQHDQWSFAVAAKDAHLAKVIAGVMENYGAERPYFAWRLTYEEPVFTHLDPRKVIVQSHDGAVYLRGFTKGCPVAEDLQPRLLQFATNNLSSAERNASALRKAIEEVG